MRLFSSSSYDHILSLPSIHHQNLQIPTNYKYFSPQTYNKSQQQLRNSNNITTLPRYPFHKNRAVSRNTNQTNQIFYKNYIPANNTATIRNSKFYLDLRSTSSSDQTISSSVMKIVDNNSTEFDPMLANHLNYRNSKRNLQQINTNSTPYTNKQRYSNFYEYTSYNNDLNSISEDSGSDDT